MDENEQNVAVATADQGQVWNPESIQDSSLLKEWNRAYCKAFKDWSWNLVWRNKYAWKFFVIYLIMFWIWILMSYLDLWLTILCWLDPDQYSLSIFGDIANAILMVWLLWFSFNIAKWLAQKVDDFFHEINWNRIWKYFVWWLLYWLVVLGWFILLIIPWIIFSVRFQFFMYAIIDKWLWPVDALKYSWRITKWRFWEIVWIDLYFWLINILWMLCLIIWLIWTTAMTNLATARYYRLISNIYDKNLQSWNTDAQQA